MGGFDGRRGDVDGHVHPGFGETADAGFSEQRLGLLGELLLLRRGQHQQSAQAELLRLLRDPGKASGAEDHPHGQGFIGENRLLGGQGVASGAVARTMSNAA